MGVLFPDTHPKMEELQIRLWREATPAQKMTMVAQLNAATRLLAIQGLRKRYPGADDAEIRRRLADRILGKDLAEKVYGPFHSTNG
jgi:propanediol dehydratase large subunit